MFKRKSQIPLVELQNQISRQKHKKIQVIDVTAPKLKLQKTFQLSSDHVNPKKPARKVISSNRYQSKIPQQHITCSQLQKTTYKEEKQFQKNNQSLSPNLQNTPSQDSNPYMLVLTKNGYQQKDKSLKDQFKKAVKKSLEQKQRKTKYFPHPDDKMHERIQSVEWDFRPLTVQQSLGITIDHPNHRSSSQQDPFKRFMGQKKYYKTYPTIFKNGDHKRVFFALEVNRPDSKLNVENQQRMHESALNKAIEKMHDAQDFSNPNDERFIIYQPKPTNKYCFVCRGHFDDYREHIRSRLHLQNDVNSKIWLSIKDICKKVQASAVQQALSKTKWARDEQKIKKKKILEKSSVEPKDKKKIDDFKQKESKKKKTKERQKSQSKISQKFTKIQKQPQLENKKNQQDKIVLQNYQKSAENKNPRSSQERKKSCQTIVTAQISKTKDRNSQATPLPISQSILQINLQSSQNQKTEKKDKENNGSRQRDIFKISKKKAIDKNQSTQSQIKDEQNYQSFCDKIILQTPRINLNEILQKQIKPLPIIKDTQKIVSILHAEYQKLVPEGQTYRKPAKPATVSLALTSNNDHKQKLTSNKNNSKKKLSEKEKKKPQKKYQNSMHNQRTIEQCFKSNQKGKKKYSNAIQQEKKLRSKSLKSENQLEENSQSLVDDERQNQQNNRAGFLGLAKTRLRQKLVSVEMNKTQQGRPSEIMANQ